MVSFDHLFDNLESGKYIDKCFGKTFGKSLDYDFGSKNLYTNPRKAKRLILDLLEAEPVISLSLRLVSCNNLSLLEELHNRSNIVSSLWGRAPTIFFVLRSSQRRFLAQHSVAMLEQCCACSKQCRNNVATLCCAKNGRCESPRVTSPLVRVLTLGLISSVA